MYYEMVSNCIKYIFFILNGLVWDEFVVCVKDLMKKCIILCVEFDNDGFVYICKYYFGLIN